MSSENRLQRRTLNYVDDGSTYKDHQDTSKDDTLYNAISTGLIALGGYGLYKSGALKGIAKPLMEMADAVAREGSDRASIVMQTIKQWSLLEHMDAAKFAASNAQFNVPARSLFRSRDSSVFYDIYADIKDVSTNSGLVNFKRVRELVMETQQDLRVLAEMTGKNLEELPKMRKNYSNTDLFKRMQNLTTFERTTRQYTGYGSSVAFNNKAVEAFMKQNMVTPEAIQQELRESGYRRLTLGDILEFVTDENGNPHFKTKGNSPIDLSTPHPKTGRNMLEELENLVMHGHHSYVDEQGQRVSLLTNDNWKNLALDGAMRIDKKGKIIDYRMSKDNTVAFLNSLANDFKLPVVGFNPAKMAGLDKIGQDKPLMGLISYKQIDPSLTGKAGRHTIGQWLSETYGKEFATSNVAVIDGTAYVANSEGKLVKLRDGLNLHDITFGDGPYGIKPTLNATRQMAGLELGSVSKLSVEEYERKLGRKLTASERMRYQTALFLDMGFQEIRPDAEVSSRSFDNMTSIDEFLNNFIDKQTRKIKVNGFEYDNIEELHDAIRQSGFNYSSVFGDGFTATEKFNPRKYATTRQAYTIKNAMQLAIDGNGDAAKAELEGFVRQFGSGRFGDEMGAFFTERSTWAWNRVNALNEGLSSSVHFLGLGTEAKANTWSYASNLLLKRALPFYLLTQAPGVINYLSEPFFGGPDEQGNRDNITKFMMREVVRPIDIGAHHAMDFTGMTDTFKFMQDMIPGTDQITELPGVHALGLGQTAEEREEYIEHGVDPVRKNRWWGSGNTPFTGGKIMYYRPNLYRRIEADVDFSDSKWGSRQEYYDNAWFPNLANPFAPLNHFVFNRNHYDKKHYYDRPYLMTAPMGEQIPIIGPLVGATIGRIGQHGMHPEYWMRDNLGVDASDEALHSLITEGKLRSRNTAQNRQQDIDTLDDIAWRQATQTSQYRGSLHTSAYLARQITRRTIRDNAGIEFMQYDITPWGFVNTSPITTPFEVYATPSGAMRIVDVPDNLNLYDVNRGLRQYSINSIMNVNQRVNVSAFSGPGIPAGNDSQAIDNAFIYGLGEQYNWLANIAGLKGFALQTFVTGKANTNARVVETSGYAYSFNKDFWDENLGGLGGNLSEITRRFVQKRNNDTEYINPIRNTMPSWMPGSNYFTDFKHGDPYSKIDNGEERLPGQGYERLYGIKGIDTLTINLSQIGYDKETIIQNKLNRNLTIGGVPSDYLDDLGSKSQKISKHLKSSWKQSGLAFATDGFIDDKRNYIQGSYDAMVYDMSSPTGVGVVDIRTVSEKQFKRVQRAGKPMESHYRQANYTLWATSNMDSKGYIYYVNRDNPDQTHTIAFQYNDQALQKTLNEVYNARRDIQRGLDKGLIGRGEMYGLVDRYRILADVAPYSQEFQDVSAQISMAKLSDKEQAEVSAIRKRVTEQKEPLRVYPYRFKTANVRSETVTVAKILDNNTILTREYGTDHAIKFAGIRVSESNSEFYRSRKVKYKDKRGIERERTVGITMNDAARKQIHQYMRPGAKITIEYDADERNKFSKDSTASIRAVVKSGGTNVNRVLIERGLAKENEDDNSPAAIRARYTKGEIAFGSAMERLTHDVIGNIPLVGSKLYQVRSPYEQYRRREVYGKDFQSWNHPIRDMLIPSIEENIANNGAAGLMGVLIGGFVGSMFGKTKFGKMVGATVGAAIPAVGKIIFVAKSDSERDWRPKRRRDQENLNEYVDTLKYVKNMKLYNQYAIKAKKENHFDVEAFMKSKEAAGVKNKLRQRELEDYKRQVKLDFKHRNRYNFRYGDPKYAKGSMNQKQTISAINKEIRELQSQRSVIKVPENALKAIAYKQAADQTMYGFNPGDSLVNIMTALPKKERQYFKHFMNAPEEEKDKILRIAPSYLRRALQSAWGRKVDAKPTLQEYFQDHALPDASWIGWDEDTNLDDVKVKLVHQNKLDPGEFDIWHDNEVQADAVNIPIPKINMKNDPRRVQLKLQQLLGNAGYENIQTTFLQNNMDDNTEFTVYQDARDDVAQQISNLNI